jgi:hypothetical protein
VLGQMLRDANAVRSRRKSFARASSPWFAFRRFDSGIRDQLPSTIANLVPPRPNLTLSFFDGANRGKGEARRSKKSETLLISMSRLTLRLLTSDLTRLFSLTMATLGWNINNHEGD